MRFMDRTLLRLADSGERSRILSPAVGAAVAAAAYDLDPALPDVTKVHIRECTLLPPVVPELPLRVTLHRPGQGPDWEAAGTTGTLAAPVAVDVALDLVITAQIRTGGGRVTRVDTESLADLGDLEAVDDRIRAEDGSLPTDPAALETRRFAILQTMLSERLERPSDLEVADFLSVHRIRTVDDLLDYLGNGRTPLRVAIDLRQEQPEDTVEQDLPVRLSVIVAEALDDLRRLLERVQQARGLLAHGGHVGGSASEVRSRTPFPFLLIMPASALDDGQLPVPDGVSPDASEEELRAARLRELGSRLRASGVAVSTIEEN